MEAIKTLVEINDPIIIDRGEANAMWESFMKGMAEKMGLIRKKEPKPKKITKKLNRGALSWREHIWNTINNNTKNKNRKEFTIWEVKEWAKTGNKRRPNDGNIYQGLHELVSNGRIIRLNIGNYKINR